MYHYLWKAGILADNLKLEHGERLQVLHPGGYNTDAGPDFSNARLVIDGVEWCGNVEIHIKASDWYRHNHHLDSVYDSVILHVVAISDTFVSRPDGSYIPQLILTFPEQFYSIYEALGRAVEDVRCSPWLGEISKIVKLGWIESLGVERLQMKAQRILALYKNCGYDWEAATFISLARGLGFGLNSEPFEMLARSLPLNFLRRHSDNLLQLEALLFGQAGMLDTSIHILDEYYQALCREYYFLARKYNIRPLAREMWKYARTRPQNFPHRRIALLAKALYGGFKLNSELKNATADLENLKTIFNWELDGYWLKHNDFDRECEAGCKVLGKGSMALLAINFIAPLVYAMASVNGDMDMSESAMEIWQKSKAESNRYIANWHVHGIECRNAFDSQALLQLRKEYCDKGRCLECRIGNWLLKEKVTPHLNPFEENNI